MRIAVLLFDRVTALDAVGPYEVLSRLPNVRVDFVADKVRLVPADTGFLSLQATAAYDDLGAPDVLVVPGGPGQHDHMDDQVLLGCCGKLQRRRLGRPRCALDRFCSGRLGFSRASEPPPIGLLLTN